MLGSTLSVLSPVAQKKHWSTNSFSINWCINNCLPAYNWSIKLLWKFQFRATKLGIEYNDIVTWFSHLIWHTILSKQFTKSTHYKLPLFSDLQLTTYDPKFSSCRFCQQIAQCYLIINLKSTRLSIIQSCNYKLNCIQSKALIQDIYWFT